jgi:hypothetical protein
MGRKRRHRRFSRVLEPTEVLIKSKICEFSFPVAVAFNLPRYGFEAGPFWLLRGEGPKFQLSGEPAGKSRE